MEYSLYMKHHFFMESSLIKCIYCNGSFEDESTLNKHLSKECKKKLFIMAGVNFNGPSSSDSRLSDTQKDLLIRKLVKDVAMLTSKVVKMSKDLCHLKTKQRIQILRTLNDDSKNFPKITIHRWFQTLSVSLTHLSMVIQKSISDTIKQVVLEGLQVAENVGMNLPIRAYQEKPNVLYVFVQQEDKTTKWVTCDTGLFRKFCSIIASKIMDLYLQNEEYFSNSTLDTEQAQETRTKNLIRLIDTSYTRGNFVSELLETTYNKLKTKWTHVEVEIEGEEDEF